MKTVSGEVFDLLEKQLGEKLDDARVRELEGVLTSFLSRLEEFDKFKLRLLKDHSNPKHLILDFAHEVYGHDSPMYQDALRDLEEAMQTRHLDGSLADNPLTTGDTTLRYTETQLRVELCAKFQKSEGTTNIFEVRYDYDYEKGHVVSAAVSRFQCHLRRALFQTCVRSRNRLPSYPYDGDRASGRCAEGANQTVLSGKSATRRFHQSPSP